MGYSDGASSRSNIVRQLKRWLFTTNHKDIGILYLFTSLAVFFIAGSFALTMRTQLFYPNNTFIGSAVYNELVTTHGLLMVLFFISAFAFAFANYVVPIQIGAKDMAFPRLNALSYWLYLFASILFLSGFAFPGGNLSDGWYMYQPLNQLQYEPQIGANAAILGLIMLSISVIVSTVNFAATITLKRAKGYGWKDLPMFTISIMFTIMMMWVAFPVFLADLVLAYLGRTMGSVVLLNDAGGALLWQHLFWFFGHPEVYIVFLPALGIMYDTASLFSGMPIYTKKLMIGAFAVETLLSLTVYMHHMFMSGTNLFWLDVSSANTLTIGIPAGVLVLGELTTKIDGIFRPETPALFTVAAVISFIIGGSSGIFLSSIALDSALNGMYWVVAHFHYIFVGTILFGIYSGLYYWYPKMFGRMYNETLGRLHFAVSFIGMNILYFPMFLMFNMPRRYYTYAPGLGLTLPNQLATIGGFIFGLGQLILVFNLIYSKFKGPVASENPWGGWSYEWLVPTPVPEFNFNGRPEVRENQLLILPEEKHETHDPDAHLSMWPMTVSLGVFLTFLGMTMVQAGYTNAVLALGLIVFVISVLGWMIDDIHDAFPEVEPDDGTKETWPFTGMDSRRLGMWVFLTGDVFVFLALIGSTVFVDWQLPFVGQADPPTVESMSFFLISFIVLAASIFSLYAAVYGSRRKKKAMVIGSLALTVAFALIYVFLVISDWGTLAAKGLGISAISTNPIISEFYDATMIHLAHIVALIAIICFFLVKAVKGKFSSGSVPSSLASVFYIWVLVALAGIIITGLFVMV